MNIELEDTQNTKAVCVPNGSFYQPIYIHFNQDEEEQENSINDVSELFSDCGPLKTTNCKSTILNSNNEDESTAIEALRQLGNISICPKEEEPLSFTCSLCNINIQIEELDNHALVCEDYLVKCCNCLLTLHYEKYKEHLPCTDDFAFSALNSIWDDEIIDENFTVITQEMTIHTSKEDNSSESNTDSVQFPEIENEMVLKGDLKLNFCEQCNKSFKRDKTYLSHLKSHSNASDTSCVNCEQTFNSKELLLQHKIQCNNVKNSIVKSNSQKHICSYCKKAFTTKQKLQRHLWVHRKKVFTCEMCSACFEAQSELDIHRLSEHQSTNGYFCNQCGKCFSSRQGLWEHNRVHSRSSNPYKCNECSKEFSSRQGYLIHKRTHNDERPYGCGFCWKAFRDGSTLRKHERIHTGVRPHICPLCSKSFNQKVVLREHVRWVHVSNWKPNKEVFECSLCDVTVTERDYLCTHIVKHSDNLTVAPQNKIIDNINSISVKDEYINSKIETKVCQCDLCEKQFPNKKELIKHVEMHI